MFVCKTIKVTICKKLFSESCSLTHQILKLCDFKPVWLPELASREFFQTAPFYERRQTFHFCNKCANCLLVSKPCTRINPHSEAQTLQLQQQEEKPRGTLTSRFMGNSNGELCAPKPDNGARRCVKYNYTVLMTVWFQEILTSRNIVLCYEGFSSLDP